MADQTEQDGSNPPSQSRTMKGSSPPLSRELSGSLQHSVAEIKSAQFYTVKPSELHVRASLGSGAQADVYKAEWRRAFAATTSTIVVAVKRLHSDLGATYRDREAITLLTDHPNLVKCFDSTVDPPYLVVTEFCAGGSLFDLLYNSKQPLTTRQIVKILVDVAAGMRCLHSQKPSILHRDLKSSNVLLTKPIRSPDQEPFAKVADFGLARMTDEQPNSWAAMTVGVGTWRWMAPEVFEMEENVQYNERVDVFSFAMLMYELLVRKLPYCDQFPVESADPRIGLAICMGLRPDVGTTQHAPVMVDIMKQAWAAEPGDRPTFEAIEDQLRKLLATLPPPRIDGDLT
mmetsp:Transcript_1822/g.3786  ORF Transcript_1822/g.3786 Transcript_1822/m.3786 type:complete len:344 (+) Transcript_1822:137-1168(+)